MFKRKNPTLGAPTPKRPRNAFDLSERSLYTQAPGMLLPVFVKDMNADEKITVDVLSHIQAQTLKGRAFLGMQQQFAAYFVPYRYLWAYWKPFLSGLSPNTTSDSALQDVSNKPLRSLKAPNFGPFSYMKSVLASSSGNYFLRKTDSLGYDTLRGFSRLYDLLGYGSLFTLGQGEHNFDQKFLDYRVNAFRFLAYQKIYQDHFLDDRFEQRDIKAYNVDDADLTTGFIGNYSNRFELRYAKYNKDFLTNFQSSPLFVSNVNSVIKTYVGNNPSVNNPYPGSDNKDNSDTFVDNYQFVSTADVENNWSLTSAASIRNLFALDRMAQISSRASKNYRAQMLAHYGVKVDSDEKISLYCGGFSRDLDSTPVIATATSSKEGAAEFGEQGSFIDNDSRGHIEFESHDFGVFMVLSWISPNLRWDADGVDPFNAKFLSEDYFHPEMEDLGLQPLLTNFIKNLDWTAYTNVGWNFFGSPKLNDSKVYGWCPRYSEYKSSYDKLHGEFKNRMLVDHQDLDLFNEGSLSFLTTHSHAVNIAVPSLSTISINPNVLDDVVEVGYNGTEATDPFRVDTQFTCSMIRNMSVSGLPRL